MLECQGSAVALSQGLDPMHACSSDDRRVGGGAGVSCVREVGAGGSGR